MDIQWQDTALSLAGLIGSSTAVIHGILTHRLMVRPIDGLLADHGSISSTIRRLVPLLMQYSTFSWFVGGIALIIAANGLGQEARGAVSLIVGFSYAYGGVANLRGTRGRHPGWMLMAAALVLIALGAHQSGS